MGQKIEVSATPIGDIALFHLDRSLTGQDGLVFPGPPADLDDPPAVLASRLFEAIPDIATVYILSNSVSVAKEGDWDEASLDEASRIVADLFIVYPVKPPEELAAELMEANYNAIISDIRVQNPDLWVIKVEPDEPVEPFKAGQYTTLALGYWEPRVDDANEDFEEGSEQWAKLVRRSYSVSSSMVDEDGELLEPNTDEIEFYIVLVRPEGDFVPGLTPRLWAKGEGDRLFLGRKFTGRYTLDDVEPGDTVVFLSTGTGEAPHNTMLAEMFRNDHQGESISVVCVRYRADLAYTTQHAALEKRYPNYRYVSLTTREPENEGNKVYIQDYIVSGQLEQELGAPLDPETTHVFLCGNPAMIGIPTWTEEGDPEFPDELGVCQILHERGFTIDHHKTRGNVHYEEYW